MATQQPQHSAGPPRVPLFVPISQRGEDSSSDAKILNGYVEKLPDGEVVVVKRPGYAAAPAIEGPTGGGAPNGAYTAYTLGGSPRYWVVGTVLYNGQSALSGAVVSQRYNFSETPTAVFLQGVTNSYYTLFSGGGVVAVPAANAGRSLVQGTVYLNGTMYTLDTNGSIYGSGINDLTTWSSLNVIQAQIRPGHGQGLFKQLTYVVALKQASMEVFADNGNPTGSPLISVPNLYYPVGTINGTTIQVIEDTAFWISGTSSRYEVIKLQNMVPSIVSTPAVSRLLQNTVANEGELNCWALRVNGHLFYAVSLLGGNLSLVYDDTSREWFQWTTATGNKLPISRTSSDGYFQGDDGKCYRMSGHEYDDAGTQFTFEVVTPRWAGGTMNKKYLHRLDVVADQASSGRLFIRSSDNDYQTWSNFRSVDLTQSRPSLHNCGTFRRRAWNLQFTSSTPLRLRELELDILPGTV